MSKNLTAHTAKRRGHAEGVAFRGAKSVEEQSFTNMAASMALDPETAEPPDQPVIMLKRIGTTTYKVAVHFNADTKETAGDKIARLIRNESAGKVVGQ